MALRAAAGLLRDGMAVPSRELDAIDRELSASLLRVVTLPDRFTVVASLADRADLAIGLKQVASVRRAAVGGAPWQDPSVTPHIGQHESPGGYGGYWAFRALGAGMNWNSGGGQPPMIPRADVRRGVLTPQTEDLAALTVSGADPTVLAFALLTPARGGGPVAYEVLNLPEQVTYVYRAGGPDPRALINQALDDVGFAPAEIHAATSGDLTALHRQDAAASPLAPALVATVKHDATWAQQVVGLLC